MIGKKFFALAALSGWLLLSCNSLFAQVTATGSLHGSISDKSLAVVSGADTVVCGADFVVSGSETVVCGADFVVSIGDDVGGTTVVGSGDVVTVDDTGLVVVVGSGTPPEAEVAAMATVPALSTPTATAVATMVRRDRSTAGIRMGVSSR